MSSGNSEPLMVASASPDVGETIRSALSAPTKEAIDAWCHLVEPLALVLSEPARSSYRHAVFVEMMHSGHKMVESALDGNGQQAALLCRRLFEAHVTLLECIRFPDQTESWAREADRSLQRTMARRPGTLWLSHKDGQERKELRRAQKTLARLGPEPPSRRGKNHWTGKTLRDRAEAVGIDGDYEIYAALSSIVHVAPDSHSLVTTRSSRGHVLSSCYSLDIAWFVYHEGLEMLRRAVDAESRHLQESGKEAAISSLELYQAVVYLCQIGSAEVLRGMRKAERLLLEVAPEYVSLLLTYPNGRQRSYWVSQVDDPPAATLGGDVAARIGATTCRELAALAEAAGKPVIAFMLGVTDLSTSGRGVPLQALGAGAVRLLPPRLKARDTETASQIRDLCRAELERIGPRPTSATASARFGLTGVPGVRPLERNWAFATGVSGNEHDCSVVAYDDDLS